MSKALRGLKLEVILNAKSWDRDHLIIDVGQPEEPEVCRVYPLRGETMGEVEARAKALAELIEIGWRVRYGSNEEEL